MNKDLYNLIRFSLLILAIVTFVILCINESRYYPVHDDPYLEPKTEVTVASHTRSTEPAETELPTEPTTPTTEPTVATEPPTEPETIPTETAYPYTDKDLEYLALVIYQEAGGDMYSDKTRLMVGTVVMNRVADDRFPDTIFDVILQYGQYGRLYWTGPMWPARAWDAVEAHAVERAYTIAERILNGERALPADVVFQSEYIQGTEVVAHQGGFFFCR